MGNEEFKSGMEQAIFWLGVSAAGSIVAGLVMILPLLVGYFALPVFYTAVPIVGISFLIACAAAGRMIWLNNRHNREAAA